MTEASTTGSATEPFEMRRLESLSNTIFGVAMTLLAYDLPKTSFATMPDWSDLYRIYAGRLVALVLSFIIAGVFWISHHRRLARQPEAGRGVVMLNLFFLLSIILLPVTNGLYANYLQSSAVAALYGIHLIVIAGLNAWLWGLVASARTDEVIISVFPVLVFLPGTLVALIAPQYAPYVWFLAFGAQPVSRLFARKAAVDR